MSRTLESVLTTLAVALLAFVVGSCEPPRIERYDPGSQQATVTGGPEEVELLLAEVNGQPITLGDFQRRLGAMSPMARNRLNGATGRRGLLEAIIAIHALADAARREGLAEDPEVHWAEERLLGELVLERLVGEQEREVRLGRAELTAYYEINAHRFRRPTSWWIVVLLVGDADSADRIAQDYQERYPTDVVPSLAYFDELLANETSVAAQPGDLGFVSRRELGEVASEPFVNAVRGLVNVGQIAGPVPVAGGWAIIQLRERREAIRRSLEAVEGDIREEVQEERRQWARSRLVRAWREEAEVAIDESFVARLQDARATRGPLPRPAPWESEREFMLDERLTPRSDLTMLGGLLGPPPEPTEAPEPTDEAGPEPNEGAEDGD